MLELRCAHAVRLTPHGSSRPHAHNPMYAALSLRSALLLTVPPLMWAGNAVVGRMAVGLVPPITLNALRWGLALLLLLPLGWRVLQHPAQAWSRRGYLSLLGLLGMGSYNALQYMALHTSTPLNVTLIAASSPVWMLAIGTIGWRVKPSSREVMGAALSLIGVALVIARGQWTTLLQIRFVAGDVLMVAAVMSWALYSWLLARPPAAMRSEQRPNWNWAEFLWIQTAFGLLWCTLATGVEWSLFDAHIEWSGAVIALLLFVAIGPAILAYRCWGLGVATVGPAVAGFFVNLTPLFTAILSAALLGEWPQWFHGLAFGLIVAGIVVSSRRR